MRILSYVWLASALFACGGDQTTSDILSISAIQTDLYVGNTTTMQALLIDPMTDAMMNASVSWSVQPSSGVITLGAQGELEEVTAVGAGSAVVTANGYGQTQELAFVITVQP
jgi:hypothetical protein